MVCISGIGARAAAAASEVLVASGATALVSWGCAAGLGADVTSGSLLLSRTLLDAPLAPDPLARVSDAWLARLSSCLGESCTVLCGTLAAADSVLASTEAKRQLAGRGAAAADMESGAIAATAARLCMPWIAVRAVADEADFAIPSSVTHSVDERGVVRFGSLVANLMRHSSETLALPTLAFAFRTALGTLRRVHRLAGSTLLAP
jgi:adenosylhomocysteine nucleosidase